MTHCREHRDKCKMTGGSSPSSRRILSQGKGRAMSGRIGRSGARPVRARWLSAVAGILGVFALLGPIGAWAADVGEAPGNDRARGRELFEREWLPGDTRTHGGDGLGPVFNDSSCIACH